MKTKLKIFFLIALLVGWNNLLAEDYLLVNVSDLYDVMPNVANCNEGVLKNSEKQKALDAFNYIRTIHNLKPVQYNSSYDKEVAKSALITVANALLDHFPKSSYYCYTQDGYNGSSTSNLFIFASPSPSYAPETEKGIQGWIIDKNVADVGHRRNMLNPFLKYTSFGRVDGYSKTQTNYFLTGMSLKVHMFPDYHNLSDWQGDFVAYPVNDYPSAFFDGSWYLSFTVIADKSSPWNNDNTIIDFSQATVKITDPGNNALSISDLKYDYLGYGVPNCLYWKASTILKEVKYTVTISNVKVNGTPRTYTYWFRITDTPPNTTLQPPTPLSPPDNSNELVPPVTLTWTSIVDAQYYALQVSTNSNFSTLLVDVKNLTNNQYTLTELSPKTKYYWRVAVIKNQQQSGWSTTFSFTTADQPLATPLLLEPIDSAVSVSIQPTFVWNSVPGATKYHLQASLDPSFDDFSLLLNLDDISNSSYTSTVKFYPKTQFYWRVRALNNTQSSPWSAVRTFWTLDPAFVSDISFSTEGNFVVTSKQTSAINLRESLFAKKIALYDLFGNEMVLSLSPRELEKIEIPFEQINSGVWILEITTSTEVKRFKLLIIK